MVTIIRFSVDVPHYISGMQIQTKPDLVMLWFLCQIFPQKWIRKLQKDHETLWVCTFLSLKLMLGPVSLSCTAWQFFRRKTPATVVGKIEVNQRKGIDAEERKSFINGAESVTRREKRIQAEERRKRWCSSGKEWRRILARRVFAEKETSTVFVQRRAAVSALRADGAPQPRPDAQ